MLPSKKSAFRLFRFAGINVFLHWSWFIAAIYFIQELRGKYTEPVWNILEYLSLFAIVLMHEFGHALACRQVGGKANEIILWPFGGVAFVSPPPRPGAVLWSIAAGPLVNVLLVPVFYLLQRFIPIDVLGFNGAVWLESIAMINLVLLIFNMLPVYPLDGGQIVRSLLWFWLGPVKSLLVASFIGFFGAAGLGALAIYQENFWLGLMAFFVFAQCQASWINARNVARIYKLPRRSGFACPACGAAPVEGEIWICGSCRKTFDPFVTQAVCPHCGAVHPTTQCIDCKAQSPIENWRK